MSSALSFLGNDCGFLRVTGCVLGAWLALGVSAGAQEPGKVFLEFDFGIARLRERYPDPERACNDTAQAIVKRCQDKSYAGHLPWRVVPCERGALDQFPRISVSLEEDEPNRTKWLMKVELYDSRGTMVDRLPAKIVVTAGTHELAGMVQSPPPQLLRGTVATWFERVVIRPDFGLTLHEKLKSLVPLGLGVVATTPPCSTQKTPQDGVLLLDFDKFGAFATGIFKVVCPVTKVADGPDEGPVRLFSIGLGRSIRYTRERGVPAINGILVRHTDWGELGTPIGTDQLKQFAKLTNGFFFLRYYEDPNCGLSPVGTGSLPSFDQVTRLQETRREM